MANPSQASPTVEDSWASKASMHEARSRLGVAVVNGQIYAIGGSVETGLFLGTNEMYNPTTDTWVFKTAMPTARASFGIAVYQNKIYCIGGLAGVEQNPYKRIVSGANEVYDPETDSWQTAASMPTPKEGVQANYVDGKIYVIGGNSTENYAYDPASNSWSQKKSMPITPVLKSGWSCASAVVDNKIYVIGLGINQVFHLIYDPKTDSWSDCALKGSFYASAAATTGVDAPKSLYVFSASYDIWELSPPDISTSIYNFAGNNWTSGKSMPTQRAVAGVAAIDDKLYVIGGETLHIGMNWKASDVTEQYTPVGYKFCTGDNTNPSMIIGPTISILSPENQTYDSSEVALNFTINSTASQLTYSLDGQDNIGFSGNITLPSLSNGAHSIKISAVDTDGNKVVLGTVYFSVEAGDSFSTLAFIIGGATAILVIMCLLVYVKKRK